MQRSTFTTRIYQLVSLVPYGCVTSYGRVAGSLGHPRGARQVGWALAATPEGLDLPAHRVVRFDGALAGGQAFGSPAVQRALLEAEGVRFLADGRVDMAEHLWPEADLQAAARRSEALRVLDGRSI